MATALAKQRNLGINAQEIAGRQPGSESYVGEEVFVHAVYIEPRKETRRGRARDG